MIQHVQGDMFAMPAEIRVNTVNCVGVMGAGMALAFKQRYPEMFKDYQRACEAGEVRAGHLHVWRSLDGAWIINFPTKRHWRDRSRYEDIESGLDALRTYLKPLGPVTVALPALGCGHGGLDWARVSPIIDAKLADLDAIVQVYAPSDSKQVGRAAAENPTEDQIGTASAYGYRRIENDGNAPYWLSGAATHGRWIALLPSKDPSQRELRALTVIVEQLLALHPAKPIAFVHNGRGSEALARRLAELGAQITLIVPFGILTRKSLTKIAAGPAGARIGVRSWAPVDATWGRHHLAEALEHLRTNADAVLLSDPDPTWFVRSARAWRPTRVAYVRYDGHTPELKRELEQAGAQPLARSSETGAPKLDAWLNGAPEPKSHEDPSIDPAARRTRSLTFDLASAPPELWARFLACVQTSDAARIELRVDLDSAGAATALQGEWKRLVGHD